MSRLSTSQGVQVVSALLEGNGVRSTCRLTGIAKGTALSLLADLGKVCAAYHDEHVRNVVGIANHAWTIEEMVKLLHGRSILDGLPMAS